MKTQSSPNCCEDEPQGNQKGIPSCIKGSKWEHTGSNRHNFGIRDDPQHWDSAHTATKAIAPIAP